MENKDTEAWRAYDRWLFQNEKDIRYKTLRPDTAFQLAIEAYMAGRRDAIEV